MIVEPPSGKRTLRTLSSTADLVVAGGGLAGVCAAVQAAREGLRVALIQDRPVFGGNASSEVRLWALGATSHMGNNNRWAREGGIIDEIATTNLWRNREGNPLLFDMVLVDLLRAEPRLTALLDTAVFDADRDAQGCISKVRAFNSQNSTVYEMDAPLFCDASGDGILGYLAGAGYRTGAEHREEFDERIAPDRDYGELLGHTIYFYTKDAGKPVTYVAPDFALQDITQIPRYHQIGARDYGCLLWWFEYGGRLDTVHDTASIKAELWKIVYGVWDYIKNSGKFPDAETLTLEWVGLIPGKRESRRFEGDYWLTQQDIVEQRQHPDAVGYGGWAIDLHPADGVYGERSPCNQYHSRGVYPIPFRCLYSRHVPNLFLAGRTISASHVAFGSTRVMMTSAHTAQAVGMAAALCREQGIRPRALLEPARMRSLQDRLLRVGQFIPHVDRPDAGDLCRNGTLSATSTLELAELPAGKDRVPLDRPRALLVPAPCGRFPAMIFTFHSRAETQVECQLRIADRLGNTTPDRIIATRSLRVQAGEHVPVRLDFDVELDTDQYALVCLMPQPDVCLNLSDFRVTGLLALSHGMNKSVAEHAVQTAPPDSGIDSFEFWLPERRPGGKNPAVVFAPPLGPFNVAHLVNGYERPFIRTNAWVASPDDPTPCVTVAWNTPQIIARIILCLDTDFDHPMETVQMGHPERVAPFCVRHFQLLDAEDRILHESRDNYRSRVDIRLDSPVCTTKLKVKCLQTHGAPAALFKCQAFGPDWGQVPMFSRKRSLDIGINF